MIKFLTPLDTPIETTDLSTFYEYVDAEVPEFTFVFQTASAPDIDEHPYEFIRSTEEGHASPGTEYAPYGASRVFCNSHNVQNLPFYKSKRQFNPIIKYVVTGNTVKICVFTKVPASSDPGYALYNDSNAQTINLVIDGNVNNTTSTGNYAYYASVGGSVIPFLNDDTSGDRIVALNPEQLANELTIVNILNSLVISKAWVTEYVQQQLAIVIPKAVDQAVKEAEVVINQRYVSR